MTTEPTVLGWDIGGVNTKVARLEAGPDGPVIRSRCLPYEIKGTPAALTGVLLQAARYIGAQPTDLHAVTMTAELSQAFRTKREGVGFVLDGLEAAFPQGNLYIYTVDGGFVRADRARELPLAVAAANWFATASLVARSIPDCIVMDIGTTTADLTPVVNGAVVVQGRTDPERLLSGELVYTGALRTPVEAVAPQVPLWGGSAGVAADGFAIIGDAHLWMGRLGAEDYTCPTPDGRPPSRCWAGERLARVVCADLEMLDEAAVDGIASALAAAQVQTVAAALRRIALRWPRITAAVVAGLGDFIAADAAVAAGLEVIPLAGHLGAAARTAPAAAVAWLLWNSGKATA